MAKAAAKKPAKKTPGAKPGKRKVNKSEAIRQYKAANPEAGPTAIADALTKKGIKVVPAQVSNVLTAAAKKDGKAPRGRRGGGDQVSLSSLMDTQAFIDKVGGVESAKQLLGAVEKLSK